MMTGKEKTLAALSGGSPEIGVGICYDGIYIRDCWEKLTSLPWWYGAGYDLEKMKAAYSEIYRNLDCDWITAGIDADKSAAEQFEVAERGGRVFRIDRGTGGETELFRPPIGGRDLSGHIAGNENPPIDMEEAKAYFGGLIKSSAARDGLEHELPLYLRAEFPDRCPVGYAQSPFQRCFPLWGFDSAMMMVHDDIELLSYAAGEFLSLERHSLRAEKARGAEAVWIEECYCDMVAPEHYRRLCFPYVRALCDEIRALGMKSIYYYTGNPRGKLDMLIDTGADMLGFEESKKGITLDITELADAVQSRSGPAGRKTGLLGNLDAISLLPNCTADQLAAALRTQQDAAKTMRGRFIFGLGSPLTPGTTPVRVKEFVEAARELGRRMN